MSAIGDVLGEAIVDELVEKIVPAVVDQVTAHLECEPLYVPVPTAARMIGLGESTVWELIRKGVLATLDVGVGRTLIPVSDLRNLPTKRAVDTDQRGTAAA